MRFIRKEHIITTIFNKEVSNIDEIKLIFKNLDHYRIEFSIIMKKYMPSQYDYININFEKIRIKKIYDDDTVDLLIFKHNVKTTMKKIPFSDIIEIKATTKKHKILDVDSDVDRWDLLDL